MAGFLERFLLGAPAKAGVEKTSKPKPEVNIPKSAENIHPEMRDEYIAGYNKKSWSDPYGMYRYYFNNREELFKLPNNKIENVLSMLEGPSGKWILKDDKGVNGRRNPRH